MLRYAGSLVVGFFAVIAVFVVMQSLVVGRQFQSNTAAANEAGASVVNLDSQNSLASQIAALPDKPGTLRTPPLPEDTALAQAAPPDIPAPSMGLPGFKPPFTAVAASAQPEEAAPETQETAASQAPAQQPVLAVGDIVLVERVEPKFPTQAVREGIAQGSVTIKFTVETDGSVSNPTVTDAKPRRGIFDDAALRAVARWKFKPLPAARDTSVTVDFNSGAGG
jgi:protein TonB